MCENDIPKRPIKTNSTSSNFDMKQIKPLHLLIERIAYVEQEGTINH